MTKSDVNQKDDSGGHVENGREEQERAGGLWPPAYVYV